jgi:hypothetical protein
MENLGFTGHRTEPFEFLIPMVYIPPCSAISQVMPMHICLTIHGSDAIREGHRVSNCSATVQWLVNGVCYKLETVQLKWHSKFLVLFLRWFMHVVRIVNGMTRSARKLLWTDGSLYTSTGVSSKLEFVVAWCKTNMLLFRPLLLKSYIIMSTHYRVHNLRGSKGENGKLFVIEFCHKVCRYAEELSHQTLLWWKNLELGSNVMFVIDGSPMAPDRIYPRLLCFPKCYTGRSKIFPS